MEPEQPSFFFAPLDSPVGGPIALGSLIEKPKFASSPLSRKPIPIPDDQILKPSPREEFFFKTGKSLDGSVGLFFDFLRPVLGVGGEISIDKKKTIESEISCDLLETRSFNPDEDYLSRSLQQPVMKSWLTQHKPWARNAKLYMITGIKIAHNATFAWKTIKESGINFHFGVDGTNSGVPLSMGPKLDVRNDKSVEQRFKVVEPFVMAYKINQLRISLKTGAVTSSESYTAGAALGVVSGDDDKEVEILVHLDDDDPSAQTFSAGRVASYVEEDEDGERCGFAHSDS